MTESQFPGIGADVELGTIAENLAEYRTALDWMASHVKLSRFGRWREYERLHAEAAEKAPGLVSITLPADEAHRLRNAFYEIAQLLAIHRAFRDAKSSAIAGKLKIIAKGNPHYGDEEADHRSRDVAFELFFAANLLERGLRVRLGDDRTRLEDLRVETDDFDLFIECKRPRTVESARRCADDAFRQLKKRLDGAERQAFGAVAFAVDLAKNRRGGYLRASDSARIQEALTERTTEFITDNRDYWNDKQPGKVIMAMVQLTGAAYTGAGAITVASAVVTIERLAPLLDGAARPCVQALDQIFTALRVNEP